MNKMSTYLIDDDDNYKILLLYILKDLSTDICNNLFSRFEQQILFLEKQAETTEPTTDRRGGLVPKHLEF